MEVPASWRESTFYKEAVENAAAYNGALMRDRRERLPYIDSQTGVAQRDRHMWRSRLERCPGVLPCQVYSYASPRWLLESASSHSHHQQRQTCSPSDSVAVDETAAAVAAVPSAGDGGGGGGGGINPSAGLVQTLEGGVVTKRSSRIAGLSSRKDEVIGAAVVMSSSTRVAMESPISSEVNEEGSDVDMDFMEDYDSEEDRRTRKKRKVPPRPRTTVTPQRLTKDQEKVKPHMCPVCHRRYKTSASLKAHTTQYHPGGGESMSPQLTTTTTTPQPHVTRVPVAVQTPPEEARTPTPDPKKHPAKRNPYCDFCLGDDAINKKTNKHERMVSCADCGRSGHPSCLQFSPELAAVVVTYRWQCIECKSCSICGNSDNDDQLLFCDDCDRGYHMYCLAPPIKEPPEGSWSCGRC